MELKIPVPMQRNCERAVRARGKPHRTDMENYLPLLQSTSLFAGICRGTAPPLLSELGACIRSYGRGEALVQAGAPSRRVGVMLTGSIEAYRPAPGGARIPITHMGPGACLVTCWAVPAWTARSRWWHPPPARSCSSPTRSCSSRTAPLPASACCRIWCGPSAINISCSPAGWTCW